VPSAALVAIRSRSARPRRDGDSNDPDPLPAERDHGWVATPDRALRRASRALQDLPLSAFVDVRVGCQPLGWVRSLNHGYPRRKVGCLHQLLAPVGHRLVVKIAHVKPFMRRTERSGSAGGEVRDRLYWRPGAVLDHE
jgi:hypothetical protein